MSCDGTQMLKHETLRSFSSWHPTFDFFFFLFPFCPFPPQHEESNCSFLFLHMLWVPNFNYEGNENNKYSSFFVGSKHPYQFLAMINWGCVSMDSFWTTTLLKSVLNNGTSDWKIIRDFFFLTENHIKIHF